MIPLTEDAIRRSLSSDLTTTTRRKGQLDMIDIELFNNETTTTNNNNYSTTTSTTTNQPQNVYYAGEVISGLVRLGAHSPTSLIKISLTGIEYTVVALKQSKDNQMGIKYLQKHTSEQRIITKQEILVNCSCSSSVSVSSSSFTKQQTQQQQQQQKVGSFRFVLSDDVPGTIKCILDGTDPVLPSQCHVYYNITASIYKNTSKAELCKSIIILPSKKSTTRNNNNNNNSVAPIIIDTDICVSFDKPMETILKSVFGLSFFCVGYTTLDRVFVEDDDYDEEDEEDNDRNGVEQRQDITTSTTSSTTTSRTAKAVSDAERQEKDKKELLTNYDKYNCLPIESYQNWNQCVGNCSSEIKSKSKPYEKKTWVRPRPYAYP